VSYAGLYFLLNKGEIIVFFPILTTGFKLSIKTSFCFLVGLLGLFCYFYGFITFGEAGISSFELGLNVFPILRLTSIEISGYGLDLPDLFWETWEFMLLRT